MNIYRQGNGANPWKVRDRVKGDKVISFPSKRLAEEYVGTILNERARADAGLPAARPNVTYDEMCELYLANYTAKSKPWTIRMLGYSRREFGHVKIRMLTPQAIEHWLLSLDLSAKTTEHLLTLMRQVLNLAVEWEYLTKSPARPRAVRLPKVTGADGVRPFESWEEVIHISQHVGRHGPMVRFACATGLRLSELLALQWRDIEGRKLYVQRTYRDRVGPSDLTKTPASRRTVALSARALEALAELPTPLNQEQLVFPGWRGGHLHAEKFRAGVWKNAFPKAGLAYRPPSQMRHTYATLALAAGATLDWISSQLGHTQIQTTRTFYARYLKAYDDRQLACLDRIGEESGDETVTQAN